MQFMMMHKVTDAMEAGGPPDPEVMEGMGAMIGEAAAKGIFLAGEGLEPTAERMHLRYEGGKRTLTDGPFTEAKELVAGFALLRVKSKAEALEWCDRFAEARGVPTEMFLGPVVETWDMGMGSKPADAPERYLGLLMLDPADDGQPPAPEQMERVGALIAEGTEAGVYELVGGLEGTAHGARLHYDGGPPKVIDGPFAESKELVAGFALFELPSLKEAIEWAKRFGEIETVHEIEVRQMHGG